jgi:hypothetical protein
VCVCVCVLSCVCVYAYGPLHSLSQLSHDQIRELPVDTPNSPWRASAAEIKRRRDLRTSHLVYR